MFFFNAMYFTIVGHIISAVMSVNNQRALWEGKNNLFVILLSKFFDFFFNMLILDTYINKDLRISLKEKLTLHKSKCTGRSKGLSKFK